MVGMLARLFDRVITGVAAALITICPALALVIANVPKSTTGCVPTIEMALILRAWDVPSLELLVCADASEASVNNNEARASPRSVYVRFTKIKIGLVGRT